MVFLWVGGRKIPEQKPKKGPRTISGTHSIRNLLFPQAFIPILPFIRLPPCNSHSMAVQRNFLHLLFCNGSKLVTDIFRIHLPNTRACTYVHDFPKMTIFRVCFHKDSLSRSLTETRCCDGKILIHISNAFNLKLNLFNISIHFNNLPFVKCFIICTNVCKIQVFWCSITICIICNSI